MKKILAVFLVLTNYACASSNHIPVDQIGFKTGEQVQVKYEWWVWGFKQEEWMDCIVVGDKVYYTCEHHYLYEPLLEKDCRSDKIRKKK